MEAFRKIKASRDLSIWLTMGRIFMGATWLNAGIEKFIDSTYIAHFPGTVGFFLSKNPNAWYADFLKTTVLPNANFYANLVMYGEISVGVALILGLFTNIAAFFGFFMNLNFFFAAGWTGPSTWGMNLNMFLVQLMFIAAYGTKYLSLDQFIANHVKTSSLHWFLLSRPAKYLP